MSFGAFGTPSQPTFGASTTTNAFGGFPPQQQTSAFGQTTSAPAFGSPATPGGFGTSAFGAPAKTPFGAPAPAPGGLFGSPATPGGFGQTTSAFGSTTTSAFGATQPSNATGLFGAPAAAPRVRVGRHHLAVRRDPAKRQAPFGQPPAFGQTGGAFGAAAQAQPGTGQPPYQPHRDQEQNTSGKRMEMVYHCITTNPAYRAKSFEELRLEDYKQGNKGRGGAAPAAGGFGSSPTTGAFGSTTTTTSPFGAPAPAPGALRRAGVRRARARGRRTLREHGAGARRVWFGQRFGATTTSPFGAPAPAPAGGLFGARRRRPARSGLQLPAGSSAPSLPGGGLFGSTPAPAPGLFGARRRRRAACSEARPRPRPALLALHLRSEQPTRLAAACSAPPSPREAVFGAPAPAPAPSAPRPRSARPRRPRRVVYSGRAGAGPGGLFGSTPAPAPGAFGAAPAFGAPKARGRSLRRARARARRLVRERAGTRGRIVWLDAGPSTGGVRGAGGRRAVRGAPGRRVACSAPPRRRPAALFGSTPAPAPGAFSLGGTATSGGLFGAKPAGGGVVRRAGPRGRRRTVRETRPAPGRWLVRELTYTAFGAPSTGLFGGAAASPLGAQQQQQSLVTSPYGAGADGSVAALAQRSAALEARLGPSVVGVSEAEATAKAADRVADGAAVRLDTLQNGAARRTSDAGRRALDAALAGPTTYSPAARARRGPATTRPLERRGPRSPARPPCRWAGRRPRPI